MKATLNLLFLFFFPMYMIAQNNVVYYKNGNIKFEQKIRNDSTIKFNYYENSKKKSETYFDYQGTWIGFKKWSETGELLESVDFVKERKEKGATDLSFIKWDKLNRVSIYILSQNNSIKNTSSIKAKKGDTIVFHYICMDDLGFEYDNSLTRNIPLILIVKKTRFLKSFARSISKLEAGKKAYIRIPPKYGYRDKPAGNFPPNTTVVYYVEILSIKKGTKRI